MSKIGIVFKFETIRQLKKPSFWISLLLLPALILSIFGLSALQSSSIEDNIAASKIKEKVVGLTDEAGVFSEENPMFKKIESEEKGIESVKNKSLDVYYYVPADFANNPAIKIYDRAEDSGVMNFNKVPFANALKAEVYKHIDPKDIVILENSVQYETIDLDEDGNPTNVMGRAIIPFAILAVFYILICVFGNRLTMALVEEKENRISEMILTSITAKSLVIGKILSLIALGFIQIAVFLIPIIAGVIIYRDNPMVASILSSIQIDPWVITSNLLLLVLSYFLFAGACTLIGSLCPTARDASQYMGIAIMGTIMPFIFFQNFIASDPNIVTYIMSYFPLSAPIALMIRNAVGSLPTFELIIGILDLAISSSVILWLTVRSFQKNAINFSVVKPHFGKRKSWKRA